MSELLETCRAVSGSNARITWVDETFLREREVGEWMELPLWIAETGDPAWRRLQEVDVSRAVAEGLRFRPVADTVRDTLEWALRTGDPGAPLASGLELGEAGMKPEREAELLAEWHARRREPQGLLRDAAVAEAGRQARRGGGRLLHDEPRRPRAALRTA